MNPQQPRQSNSQDEGHKRKFNKLMVELTASIHSVMYQEAFSRFDQDRDGLIDIVELHQLMIFLGENVSKADIQELFHRADDDDDDLITFDQFLNLMVDIPGEDTDEEEDTEDEEEQERELKRRKLSFGACGMED